MSWFSADDRIKLRLIADDLIPEAEGMPSASAVGAADALLDRAIHVRADLAPLLLRALRQIEQAAPRAGLERLREADDEAFAALTLAIAAAYYMAPEVCALLGYHGPQRLAPAAEADSDIASLLAPVVARGRLWRSPH